MNYSHSSWTQNRYMCSCFLIRVRLRSDLDQWLEISVMISTGKLQVFLSLFRCPFRLLETLNRKISVGSKSKYRHVVASQQQGLGFKGSDSDNKFFLCGACVFSRVFLLQSKNMYVKVDWSVTLNGVCVLCDRLVTYPQCVPCLHPMYSRDT